MKKNRNLDKIIGFLLVVCIGLENDFRVRTTNTGGWRVDGSDFIICHKKQQM